MDSNQRQMKDASKGQCAPPYSASNRTELEDTMKDAFKGQRAESAASNRTELEDMLTALYDTTEKQFKMVCLKHGPRCPFIRNRTESEDKMKDASEQQRTKSPPYSAASISAEVEDMVSLRLQVALQAGRTQNILVKNEAENTDYDTRGKRGLLCIIQNKDPDWKDVNERDKEELLKFFKDTLGFDVEEYSCYGELDSNIETKLNSSSEQYYCLVICISGHGDENGIEIENSKQKTVHEIKKRFGNEKIKTLDGVPKIIILDTCRGGEENETVLLKKRGEDSSLVVPMSDPVSSTTDLDCLIVHAATHGYVSFYDNVNGSVGIQFVMNVLQENWENDHLEEMLIDAREEVAKYMPYDKKTEIIKRQTLEIQTTLTKRLKFVKSKKDIPSAESSYKKF